MARRTSWLEEVTPSFSIKCLRCCKVRELTRLVTLAGKKLRRIDRSTLAPDRLLGQSSTDLECWLNTLRHQGIHRVVTRSELRYEEGRIEQLASASATLCRVIARKTSRRGAQK